MRARPLTTMTTLGILVCGATVGLEAMGVLFQSGAKDPGQRSEAFLARLEADLDSMVAPSAPVDLPSETEQEPPWQEPDRTAAAEPAPDTGEQPAEGPRGDDPERRGGERVAAAVDGAIDQSAQLIGAPETDAAPAPPPQEPAAPAVVQASVHATEAEQIMLAPPRRDRPRPMGTARVSTAGGTATGCPILDWFSQ